MLTHAAGVTTLTWTPPVNTGSNDINYDTLASLSADDFQAGRICVESDGIDTVSTDSTAPGVGQTIFFLVRAGNACGDGSAGLGEAFSERLAASCP